MVAEWVSPRSIPPLPADSPNRDVRAMRRVLMIAYHFPPLAGSSGIQRTLRFASDLPRFGWEPSVLTVNPRAYERVSDDLLPDVPDGIVVRRAFALDAARHLSVLKRYPSWLARPDRWLSWLAGAIPTGLRMIRQLRPDVLWSTYPIATAHLVGAALARLSDLPWVADFRDPMAHEGYPIDPRIWRSYKRVEEKTFARAQRCVFATPGAARLYRERYPDAASRIAVIANGFDERAFARAALLASSEPLNPGAVTLVHSGVVYPEWRSPEHLFVAMQRLIEAGRVQPGRLRLRFRAAVSDSFVLDLAARYGMGAVVEMLPPLGYLEALGEMMRADGLLVLQSFDCNDQVPAKLYEYFRAGRPVLGLTDPRGDTAAAMRAAGFHHIAALESDVAIEAVLADFVEEVVAGTAPVASAASVDACSRARSADALATLLEEVRCAGAGRIGFDAHASGSQ